MPHLIMPKCSNQRYHFHLQTKADLTNAAQAMLERHRVIRAPPLQTVEQAKHYLLENFREHYDLTDKLDFGSPSVWSEGRQEYTGVTLREHIKSQGLLAHFGLD